MLQAQQVGESSSISVLQLVSLDDVGQAQAIMHSIV